MQDSAPMRLLLGLCCSCAYALLVLRPLPPGTLRLALSVPVVAFCIMCPLGFKMVTIRGNLGFVFSWVASFKLLAASGGRGPLARPSLSTVQFLCMLLLPYYTTKVGHSEVKLRTVVTSITGKFLLFACLNM